MTKFTTQFIDQLRNQLKKGLPGVRAQYEMAPVDRQSTLKGGKKTKFAGVVALLYPNKKGEATICLMERVKHEHDKHAGQISFPGGQLEAHETKEEGALRELEEEFGVESSSVEVLGTLTELYIPVSDFMVYPFLAIADERPDFKRDDSEVETILEIPLEQFEVSRTKHLFTGNYQKEVPCFKIGKYVIWGATAMMLNELLVLTKGE